MRYELKFVFNNHELFKFKSWLISETRFKKKYSPRIVNSIYFDDINNGSANDNLAGISLRLGGHLAKGPYLPETLEGLTKTTKAVLGKN